MAIILMKINSHGIGIAHGPAQPSRWLADKLLWELPAHLLLILVLQLINVAYTQHA